MLRRAIFITAAASSPFSCAYCDSKLPPVAVCRSFEQLRARYTPLLKRAAEEGDADATDVLEGFQETEAAIRPSIAIRTIVRNQGVITLVGTCHNAEQSSRDVIRECKNCRPSCLVLELCEERLMPSLVCPHED